MPTVAAIVCMALKAFTCEPAEIRVIDGDTVAIGREKIRIEGIDAPETEGLCPAESRIAARSTARLTELLSGAEVVIERRGKDRYRRTLATVKADGRDVGEVLMREGLARKWEKRWKPGLDEIWCR